MLYQLWIFILVNQIVVVVVVVCVWYLLALFLFVLKINPISSLSFKYEILFLIRASSRWFLTQQAKGVGALAAHCFGESSWLDQIDRVSTSHHTMSRCSTTGQHLVPRLNDVWHVYVLSSWDLISTTVHIGSVLGFKVRSGVIVRF